MEIEIKSKEPKPLLKRTEVIGRIAFQGATPTKKETVAAIAKAMKAKQELVIVRRIETAYGDQSGRVLAYVYDDKATLDKLEHEYVKKKHGEKKTELAAEEKKEETSEKKPAEEEKPAEKKDEKPAVEEKKTEPATEEKKEETSEKKPADEKKKA